MDKIVTQFIEKRIRMLEELHHIHVLIWAFRGSLDIGIYRENSDLDIIFIFRNLEKSKISAIHDIIGHGFDLWGWDIDDVIKTIRINTALYCQNEHKSFETVTLSQEHDRGSLAYHFGVFCAYGSKNIGGNPLFLEEAPAIFGQIMEKRVMMNDIMLGVKNAREKIVSTGTLSANEYLYTVWRILLSQHVFSGGLPGEADMSVLLDKYGSQIANEVFDLNLKYKKARAKHSLRIKSAILNEFIVQESAEIERKSLSLSPENRDHLDQSIQDMHALIARC